MNENKTITSNYEKVLENWRLRFLAMDHQDLIRKFDLKADEEYLYLTYFSKELQINRKSGGICEVENPKRVLGFDTCITIYNLFHYAIDRPVASGKMVPFREVKRVYPFEAAYRKTILKRFQEQFNGHVDALRSACEKLGGIDLGKSDAGYLLSVFPFLNIAVFFWDGDEEFEAQANLLFDSNITDFVHEENVVGIAAEAVYYLTEAAGMQAEAIYMGEERKEIK